MVRGESWCEPRWLRFAIVAGCIVGSGAVCVVAGKDVNFDLLNYHYYVAHALLHGRFRFDHDVAQLQTYHFALLDLPFYLLVHSVPPRVVAFTMGALHGIALVLCYLLARRVLGAYPSLPPRLAVAGALLCTVVGGHAPATINTFGTSTNDMFAATLVLASLLVIVRARQDGWPQRLWPFHAGLLCGFAVGGKLTAHVFFLPLLLTAVLAAPPGGKRLGVAWRFATGVALTFACTAGLWLLELWERFGNPLFPYYNDVFASPYAAGRSFAYDVHRPATLGAALVRPLLMATTNSLAMELPYRDARYAILCLVVLALLVARCCGRRAPAVVPHDGTPFLLLAFYGAAFVLWTRDSGYLRFALTLELLGPLLAVALLLRWPRRMALALAVLALGATVALVKAPRRGGKPWTSDYFGVTAPEVPPGEVLGVLIGDEASAYYVPFFPPRVRFVRLESNYQAPFGDTAMKRDIRALIERHDGPMFLLSYAHRRAQDVGVLASYRLQLGPGEAVPVPSAVDCGAVWRPLSRRPAAAGAEGSPR